MSNVFAKNYIDFMTHIYYVDWTKLPLEKKSEVKTKNFVQEIIDNDEIKGEVKELLRRIKYYDVPQDVLIQKSHKSTDLYDLIKKSDGFNFLKYAFFIKKIMK